VLAALAPHVDAVKEARECADYVRTNRHRMRYADFHAAGLCTSTGVENELFSMPNCMMVFGDAKKTVSEFSAALKQEAKAA
jgi:hypothetical protein